MAAPWPSHAVKIHGRPAGSWLKANPPNRPLCVGRARVVEVDRDDLARLERAREVDEHRVQLALVLERRRAVEDLVDVQVGVEIELDTRRVLEHAERDRVLPADELLVRLDPDVEVIRQQVVVRAELAVFAAEDVAARRRGGRRRRPAALRRLRGSAGRERGKDGESDQQVSAERSCRHGFEAERTTGLRTRVRGAVIPSLPLLTMRGYPLRDGRASRASGGETCEED